MSEAPPSRAARAKNAANNKLNANGGNGESKKRKRSDGAGALHHALQPYRSSSTLFASSASSQAANVLSAMIPGRSLSSSSLSSGMSGAPNAEHRAKRVKLVGRGAVATKTRTISKPPTNASSSSAKVTTGRLTKVETDEDRMKLLEPIKHAGELLKYECGMCHKKFRDKFGWSRHAKAHTGEKSFKCDHCDKVFAEKGNLTRHQVVHTGVRKYECKTCKKTMAAQWLLDRHMKVHEVKLKCKFKGCGEVSTDKEAFKMHVAGHETESSHFVCKDCGKEFETKSSFTRHSAVHNKSLSCSCCDSKFRDKYDLARHARLHEKQKSLLISSSA
jgi:uncharacterized Zn-finger protein